VTLGNASHTLAGAVAAHVIDAPVAAIAWLLAEQGVPVLVAGRGPVARDALADALVRALPPERRPNAAAGGSDRLVRVVRTLATDTPPGVLRAALSGATRRSGLVATVDADDLEGVLSVLASQGLSDDETSFLGCVLVVAANPDAGGSPRVVAVHYLRPVVRDAGGHHRRLAPAVLATWDPVEDRWEDFTWGVVPDLAERCRIRAVDLEVERDRRAVLLGDLAASGRTDQPAFDAAVAGLSLDGAGQGRVS
jgi:hypothetical protein